MSPPGLDADEIDAYREQGVVVPRWRLPPDRLAGLRAALDQVIADNPGVRPEQLISAHIARGSAEHVKGSDEFLRFACDPEIVRLVTPLIGPDVILWGCQVFCKPAGDGREVPWHQDGQYWPIRPLATCTLWLALDDSRVDNGCLRVIPGSHAGQRIGEHVFEDRKDMIVRRSLAKEEFEEGAAVDVELEPGQMVMFDVYTVHGATHNRGAVPRAGYALRFMPSTSHFDHDGAERRDEPGYAHNTRPLFLARGRDVSGLNDFERGHPG